jgi:methylthioribose-1-phosphate isomerase
MGTVNWNEAEHAVVMIDQLGQTLAARWLEAAQARVGQDVATNRQTGKHGSALVRDGDTILHDFETWALATVDYGTVSRTETGILRPLLTASLSHALEEACSP